MNTNKNRIKNILELLEKQTKKIIKEADEKQIFSTTSKECYFSIVGIREIYSIAESDDYDLDNIYGVLYWSVTLDTNRFGISGIEVSNAKMKDITFTLKIFKEDSENEQYETIDTSDYIINTDEFEMKNGQLYVENVEIDIVNKRINVS